MCTAAARSDESPDGRSTPEQLLTTIATLNKWFRGDVRERLRSLLLEVQSLREPLTQCYWRLLKSADTTRLYQLKSEVTNELDRMRQLRASTTDAESHRKSQHATSLLVDSLILFVETGLEEVQIRTQAIRKAGTVKDLVLIPLVEMWERRGSPDATAIGVDAALALIGMLPFIGTMANLLAAGRLAAELFDEPEDLEDAAARFNLILAADWAVTMAKSGHLAHIQKATEEWDRAREETQQMVNEVCATIESILRESRAVH